MKAILMSIKPKWCEKIFSGKKTIEVCKTAPKETPFKVYVYCTKERMTRVPSMYAYLHKNEPRACAEYGTITTWGKIGDVTVNPHLASEHVSFGMHGKVVGEFVCDKVIKYDYQTIACAKYEVNGADVKEQLRYNAGTCLNSEEMYSLSKGKDLRGLHISKLKIYDNPKPLNSFKIACNKFIQCNSCEYRALVWHEDKKDFYYECRRPAITRPPRSWRYVEELNYGL